MQVRLKNIYPRLTTKSKLFYRTIFYSFLQNHILNTYFNQLHPSHRRDACNKHPHWTAAFVNKIWHIWIWICLMKATKKPEKWTCQNIHSASLKHYRSIRSFFYIFQNLKSSHGNFYNTLKNKRFIFLAFSLPSLSKFTFR